MRIISCTIEQVDARVKEQAKAGYFVTHVAARIMQRPRGETAAGYGIWRSEDPVLVLEKSSTPRRQIVALPDDVTKREPQINEAAASGLRLVPNEIVPLRSWAGQVTVDAYLALFEAAPGKYEYKVVNAAIPTLEETLRPMLRSGFRTAAFVAPDLMIVEKGPESSSSDDRYLLLNNFDAQHVATELRKAAVPGADLVTVGASTSGLFTSFLFARNSNQHDVTEYKVEFASKVKDLEAKLNAAAAQGFAPVPGGILPVRTSHMMDRGMTPPPQTVELILGRPSTSRRGTFRVISGSGKDLEHNLTTALQDQYQFIEYVSINSDDMVILEKSSTNRTP